MADAPALRATRVLNRPLLDPVTHPLLGDNIQGPSLIATPSWVKQPLGKYYLYSADHKGSSIRLSYADDLSGPFTVHNGGTLQLADSHFLTEPPPCTDDEVEAITDLYVRRLGIELANSVRDDITTPHIASPDVHVDHQTQQIVMYYHGLESLAVQQTRVATSRDGINFVAQPTLIAATYLRAFSYEQHRYALTMPGQFWRLGPGLAEATAGPKLFSREMRHAAVLVRGHTLYVFYTVVGDAPERIVHSSIDLRGDWLSWTASDAVELLRPEHSWEGADRPLRASMRSVAPGRVNELRDPAIFEEAGRVFLLYAIAGESGIGLAELHGL